MNHQDQRDALLYARFLDCSECKKVSFPIDAEWLDSELILVTYPAICPHMNAITAVVEARELIIATAAADPERYLPGRRCAGRNRRGRHCRAYAKPGSDFCIAHDESAVRGAPGE